jgi:phosphoenolpyruvate synthase/pyruvate phosphate dikinase
MSETSFAGQQETFLNVRGEEELLRAIRHCWASLWTARALIYRVRQHIDPLLVRMAVIVQQMVEATASGVLFTSNPVSGTRDEMVINASWGLGEALVSGHVSPDVITINKESGQVKSVQVAEKLLMTVANDSGVSEQAVPLEMRQKAVLLEEQIGQLYQLGRIIEHYFHAPQDIEWAISANQIYILQTRPVTTQPFSQAVTVPQSDLPVPGDDSWDRQGEQPLQPFDLWTHTQPRREFS